jgi:8-oxo-dGTP pyrophosphatase MutT (NUDIX family)
MIAFEQGGLKFNYRIAGVVINDARVLLHRGESDGFWTLPGGRGELLEPSQDTLRREMLEELGVEVSVHRLLWVVENFFEYEGRSYHELGFYFSMAFPQDSHLYLKSEPFLGDEEGIKLIYQWFPIDEIERIELYPTFLKQGLKALPEYIQHIVRFD